jgi:thiol-disulfide isomerase/thioredoxin
MVAAYSEMLPLGTPVIPFRLPDVASQSEVAHSDALGERGLLVMFICNHCPYVVHIRPKMVELAHEALDAGVGVVAINANSAISHPQDGPPHMRALAGSEGWRFPYLFDASQEVAKAYTAACTPDFFLFDGQGRLHYRGRMDGSTPGNDVPVTGDELGAALRGMVAGQDAPPDQSASIGCNIKWVPGNAPDYFG